MLQSVSKVRDLFSALGVERVFYKRLAANDDPKNQIYLGPDERVLRQLKPVRIEQKVTAGSTTKKKKTGGSFYGHLHFYWLQVDKDPSPAPHAKLIYYPQYPEVRLSGFLRGCPSQEPGKILKNRLEGRHLFLGQSPSGETYGLILHPDQGLENQLARLEVGIGDRKSCLMEVRPRVGQPKDNQSELLERLRTVVATGPPQGQRVVRGRGLVACSAANAGGLTLEALLGIETNSDARPDYLGFELKAHSRKSHVMTLMTPNPDAGVFSEIPASDWIARYGYPDRKGRPDRLNYGGVYRNGEVVSLTSHQLTVDPLSAHGGIHLRDPSGVAVATWSYTKLLEHWITKHQQCMYVSYEKTHRKGDTWFQYFFPVACGINTEFSLFHKAFQGKSIFIDPGCKLEGSGDAAPKAKVRFQFRSRFSALNLLYKQFQYVAS